MIFPPGTSYAYSNPGMAALAYAVTASLKGAPQTDIHALLKARLIEPLGIPDIELVHRLRHALRRGRPDISTPTGAAARSRHEPPRASGS